MKRYWTFALTAYLIYISSFLLSCGVLYPLHSFTRQVLDSLGRWRIDHDRSNWIQTDGPFEDIRRIVQRQTGLAIWMQKCGLTMRARIQSHNEHLKRLFSTPEPVTGLSCVKFTCGTKINVHRQTLTRERISCLQLGLLFQGNITCFFSKGEG